MLSRVLNLSVPIINSTPRGRHPERTTAKRAVVKDPVKHVSRSDSAYKYIKQMKRPTVYLYDAKQHDCSHLQRSRFATHV